MFTDQEQLTRLKVFSQDHTIAVMGLTFFIITNLYTGCTFQHKNAVINMCPVKE